MLIPTIIIRLLITDLIMLTSSMDMKVDSVCLEVSPLASDAAWVLVCLDLELLVLPVVVTLTLGPSEPVKIPIPPVFTFADIP